MSVVSYDLVKNNIQLFQEGITEENIDNIIKVLSKKDR